MKKTILVAIILTAFLFVQVNLVNAEVGFSTDVQMISGSNPTFVNQPVKFAMLASGGTPPYSYQWYVDGSTVFGATGETFVFVESTPGFYHISVTVYDSKGVGGEPFMMRAEGGIGVVVQAKSTLSPTVSDLPQSATNQSLTFSSGVTLYSPLNKTYTSNVVYCNGSFSCPTELLETLNYSLDEKYLGYLPWKLDMGSLGNPVTNFNGSVSLPNLNDGSHKLSIGVKEELWDGTHLVNTTTWVNTVYFTVITNQSLPSLTSSPTPTSSIPEFSWLTILPILLAIPIVLVMARKRLQRNV